MLVSVWIVWELVAAVSENPVFPSGFGVLWNVLLFLSEAKNYYHIQVTLIQIVIGFFLGTLAGVSVGVLLGAVRFLGRAIEPYISALSATPKIVFLPVALAIFGSGIASKAALATLGSFFPIVLSTYVAMLSVRPIHVKVGCVFHLSPLKMATKIYLPSIARPIVVGMRIGLGVAVTTTLLAEVKMSKAGLGHMLMEHYNHFRIEQMYAVLLVALGFVAAGNTCMSLIIRKLSRGNTVRTGNSGNSGGF